MLIFIIVLTLFLLWTLFNSIFLPALPKHSSPSSSPAISVLVPMRNEERNVQKVVSSLKKISYEPIEIIILNDQSTDRTAQLLKNEISGDFRFTVLSGRTLPEGWVGKVHACHQLQQAASGDYLLFIDADVQFRPEAVEQSLALMQKKQARLLSGFPRFEVTSPLSRLLVPMQHFIVLFHLPLMLANFTRFPAATAAHGAWMMFERQSYDQIGGHEAVRNSLVEDVHISRKMKAAGHRMLLANITKSVSSRMYETDREVWEGFLKNSFTGIGRSTLMAAGLTLFYATFYISPLFFTVYGAVSLKLMYIVPYALIVAQQAYVMFITGQRLHLAFLMPFQAAATIAVMLQSMRQAKRKQAYSWKGRHYS